MSISWCVFGILSCTSSRQQLSQNYPVACHESVLYHNRRGWNDIVSSLRLAALYLVRICFTIRLFFFHVASLQCVEVQHCQQYY